MNDFNDYRIKKQKKCEDIQKCKDTILHSLATLSGKPSDLSRIQKLVTSLTKAVREDSSYISVEALFLRTLPYTVYLTTYHWQERRKIALKAADFACQLCNARDCELHVHHRTYERIGSEAPSDLTVLYEKCHSTFHDKNHES